MSSLANRRYLLVGQAGILFLLTAWLYAPIGFPLLRQWWQDPNYTHGLFVPAFSLFLLWKDRARLAELPLKPAWPGLVIFLLALLTLIVGVISHEFFLPRISLLLLMSGMVVFLAGWGYLAAVAFPLAFLILMLPSSTLFSQISLPLQIVSTKVATLLLRLAGVAAVREGNIILLQTARLGVTEACSGIRFLFSLITLAVIYGYLAESKIGVRVSLALAAVPISVLANALRVAGTGFVVQHWGIERAEGTLHLFSGWLIFLGALGMLFAFHRLAQMLCPGKRDCEKQQECA